MKIFIPALSLLLLLISPGFAQEEDWINITRPWLDNQPDYFPGSNPYTKRVSAVACDPTTGLVYLILPNTMGLWQSADHGESWVRVEDQIYQGRNFGGFSHNMDFETGALLVCALKTGYAPGENAQNITLRPQPVYTCDQGKTWQGFNVPPEGKGGRKGAHDGWTWIATDWSTCPPKTLLAKEHHTKPGDVWISQDAGQTWTRTDQESRHLGVINETTFVIGKEDGIHRSTDAGATWEKVSDLVPVPQIAVEYAGKVYWAAGNTVIVTEDGDSWQPWGSEVDGEITHGPYFGRSAEEAMVATREGLFITRDNAQTWQRVADKRGGMRSGYAWDPAENIIYFSAQNEEGDVWKLDLP